MSPLEKNDPREAWVIVPGADIVGRVTRGEQGYTPCAEIEPAQADELNHQAGVSHAMRESMAVGSMFGWHVPGADPAKAETIYAKARALAGETFSSSREGRVKFVREQRRRHARKIGSNATKEEVASALLAVVKRWQTFAKDNGWTDRDYHDADGTGWISELDDVISRAELSGITTD